MSQKFQEIINSEKPVLIDFFATWCQPCRVQSSVLVTVKEQVGDAARIIRIQRERSAYSSDFQKRTITMERKRRA
jgi:thiol-disulfide isomerase/thioredoxin